MTNYNNPYGRSRHNRKQDWWKESEYHAGSDGNRDQYDDYPTTPQRSRFGNDYNDYGYEASNFSSDSRQARYYPNRNRQDSSQWGNEYDRGYRSYNDAEHNYRGGYGGRDMLDMQHVYHSKDNYRGEFGDSRDYTREGNYRNYNQDKYRDHDRSFWDKTTDEVSSWFGDDGAERRRRMDKIREGEHRGKGPKGYKRTDERMRDDINDRLSDDPWIDASDVEVEVINGEATLTGHVPDRMAKRRAEDITESVSGVMNVENRIRVSNTSTDKYRNSSFNTDL